MTQQTRPSFELLLGEVSLKAPETPLYLRLATQVLEARRQEMENGHAPDADPQPPVRPEPVEGPPPSPAAATLEPPPAAEVTETVEAAEPAAPPPDAVDAPEPATPALDAVDAADAAPDEETPAEEPESIPVPFSYEPPAPAEAVPPEPPAREDAPAFLFPPPSPVVEAAPAVPTAPSAGDAAPARRARWFRGQLPVVYFEDGSSRVMESLDALKDLLRSRGLTPHPRGDASMLLWQVRNRLNLDVGQVDA